MFHIYDIKYDHFLLPQARMFIKGVDRSHQSCFYKSRRLFNIDVKIPLYTMA